MELRYRYPLSQSSNVFDLGGYKGDFAGEIYARTPCKVYCFEPIQEYYESINKRFNNNSDIRVFKFGLSSHNQTTYITKSEESSSTKKIGSQNKETIELKNIMEFIGSEKITKIDLLKINIEGGEYEVLEKLIGGGYIGNIRFLQIQFHKIEKYSAERREAIRKELAKTHYCTYCYEFIWEEWRRKNNGHTFNKD